MFRGGSANWMFRQRRARIFFSSGSISPQTSVRDVMIFSNSWADTTESSPLLSHFPSMHTYFMAANRPLPARSKQIRSMSCAGIPRAVILREGTPIKGMWRDREKPFATANPILRLVNDPGPRATATPLKFFLLIPVSSNAFAMVGDNSTVCLRLVFHTFS